MSVHVVCAVFYASQHELRSMKAFLPTCNQKPETHELGQWEIKHPPPARTLRFAWELGLHPTQSCGPIVMSRVKGSQRS